MPNEVATQMQIDLAKQAEKLMDSRHRFASMLDFAQTSGVKENVLLGRSLRGDIEIPYGSACVIMGADVYDIDCALLGIVSLEMTKKTDPTRVSSISIVTNRPKAWTAMAVEFGNGYMPIIIDTNQRKNEIPIRNLFATIHQKNNRYVNDPNAKDVLVLDRVHEIAQQVPGIEERMYSWHHTVADVTVLASSTMDFEPVRMDIWNHVIRYGQSRELFVVPDSIYDLTSASTMVRIYGPWIENR